MIVSGGCSVDGDTLRPAVRRQNRGSGSFPNMQTQECSNPITCDGGYPTGSKYVRDVFKHTEVVVMMMLRLFLRVLGGFAHDIGNSRPRARKLHVLGTF